jgi:hypothetical protein
VNQASQRPILDHVAINLVGEMRGENASSMLVSPVRSVRDEPACRKDRHIGYRDVVKSPHGCAELMRRFEPLPASKGRVSPRSASKALGHQVRPRISTVVQAPVREKTRYRYAGPVTYTLVHRQFGRGVFPPVRSDPDEQLHHYIADEERRVLTLGPDLHGGRLQMMSDEHSVNVRLPETGVAKSFEALPIRGEDWRLRNGHRDATMTRRRSPSERILPMTACLLEHLDTWTRMTELRRGPAGIPPSDRSDHHRGEFCHLSQCC